MRRVQNDEGLGCTGCFLIAVGVLFVFGLISGSGPGDLSAWEDNPRGPLGITVIGLFGLLVLIILLITAPAYLLWGHRAESEPDKPESPEDAKREEKKKYEAW